MINSTLTEIKSIEPLNEAKVRIIYYLFTILFIICVHVRLLHLELHFYGCYQLCLILRYNMCIPTVNVISLNKNLTINIALMSIYELCYVRVVPDTGYPALEISRIPGI